MNEIVTRTFNEGKFRIRVVKLSGDLIAIEGEVNHGDAMGWERGQAAVKINRDEIVAAAELLGITQVKVLPDVPPESSLTP